MAIDSGGGGQEGVDWDAVFRTIDQQQIGTDLARDPAGGGSGTLSLNENHHDYQSHWPSAHGLPPEPHGMHGGGQSSQGDSELLRYFDRQLGAGAPSNRHDTSSASRTMDPASAHYGHDAAESERLHRPSTGPLIISDDYNVAFRAMMGEDSGGLVPAPRDRPTRGRRRSRSLGPRRTYSEGTSNLTA
jgi:hypothetical protein